MKSKMVLVLQKDGTEKVVIIIKDKDLRDHLFANKKFENFIFDNCNLSGVDFTYAKLLSVKFNKCQLTHTNFTGSLLSDVTFHKCSAQFANLSNTIILRPLFSMSFFKDAIFDGAITTSFDGYLPCFENVDFTKASIKDAFVLIGNFKGADAKPEAGFRTKKGGGGYYKVPVCKQECKNDKDHCNQSCDININPDKFKKGK